MIGIIKDDNENLVFPFFFMGILAAIFDYLVVRSILNNTIRKKQFHQKRIDLIEGKAGEMSDELKASMNRLSNKTYLDALRAHGVTVPNYFYQRLKTYPIQRHQTTLFQRTQKKPEKRLQRITNHIPLCLLLMS